MKTTRYFGLFATIACCMAQVVQPRPEPRVVLEQFEPHYEQFFDWEHKFKAPQEVIAPNLVYPLHPRSIGGFHGEVVVLVEVDRDGFPITLAVLYGTQKEFSEAAVWALKKARWKGSPRPVWFYYKAVFTPNED
jgi:outer membrane biosynthesis protein TonB